MKKRILELFLVIAVVAVVVVLLKPESGLPEQPVDTETPVSMEQPMEASTLDESFPTAGPRKRLMGPTAATLEVDPASASLWEARWNEAQAFLGQGANDRAEVSLDQALDLAPQVGSLALAQTLDALALVKFRQGQYERSVVFQKQAIAVLQSSPDALKHQDVVAHFESRLAQALQAQGRELDALAALERSRLAYRAAHAPGSPAFAESMRDLADLHRSFGDNDGAVRLLEE